MNSVQSLLSKIGSYFNNIYISGNYVQAGVILILLFVLVLSLAKVRSHFVKGSLNGGVVGLVFGIIFTLIVEGFLLLNGQTALMTVFGWKNAPKPFSTALEIGKDKFKTVLGVSTTNPTTKDAISVIQSLDPNEITKIKAIICTP